MWVELVDVEQCVGYVFVFDVFVCVDYEVVVVEFVVDWL